jgi:hypothetical protein
MHTISFGFQPTMKVNIHNECTRFMLLRQEYFSIGATRDSEPNLKANAGSMMSVDFKYSLATFEGALICKLERERSKTETKDQSELIYNLLLVVWKSEGYRNFHVLVRLIECDNTFHWDKIKPEVYYQRYASQLSTYTSPIRNTWLTRDGTVLMTRLKLDLMKKDGILDLTISEKNRDGRSNRPEWINLER